MTSLSLNEMFVTISLRTLLSHWGERNLSLSLYLFSFSSLSFVHSLIHSFSKYLSSSLYVPDTVPGTGDTEILG